MMKAFVGIFVLSLALAANGASLNTRIVGGSNAPKDKYPYQAAVFLSVGRFHCGGSIINESYILTAAHCLRDRTAGQLSIQVGSNFLSESGKRYKVDKLIPHAEFSHGRNDIGLIRLSEKIVFNNAVQPIPLTADDVTMDGTSVVLTGWGRKSSQGSASQYLQEISLEIFDHEKCQEWMDVSPSEICTLTRFGEGACFGDSGGPLVADGFQIGIVSWGLPCARGMPDVFTRVHSYLDWINENMNRD